LPLENCLYGCANSLQSAKANRQVVFRVINYKALFKAKTDKMPTVKKSPGKKTSIVQKIDLNAALQEHFGFKEFKDQQKHIIETLLSGKDTFVIMPTGGGKSLCYQLPAMISPGVAIIVSPLIALMKNQVDLVRGYSSNDDVAHFLNSTLSRKEIKEVHEDLKSGRTKML
jgi:ATP-dependent DNA helicase RecQ